jgi:hypothetical protein
MQYSLTKRIDKWRNVKVIEPYYEQMINPYQIAQINNCFFDVSGKNASVSEMYYIIKHLPMEIKLLAKESGWYDKEVSDKTLLWIKENQDKIV